MTRKQQMQAVLEQLGGSSHYLGPPSFSYEITTDAGAVYILDREGVFTTTAGEVVTLDEILNPRKENQPTPVMDGVAVAYPLEHHTGTSLHNLVNMLASRQQLILQAFKSDQPFLDASFAEDLRSQETASVFSFSEAIDGLGADRHPGLHLDFAEDTVVVTLQAAALTPEQVAAFRDLVAHMNQMAIQQQRVSLKPAQMDNPKYAMRTWLIRLGMGGDAFKESRRILLASLPGNGAFRQLRAGDSCDG